MKLLIINNPRAGQHLGTIYDFVRMVADEDTEIVIRTIGADDDTETLLADAADFDLVVPSGGDGTICSIAYCLRNSGIKVLPFPAGTSNALTLNLLSPTEPFALADLAHNGYALDFDIGELAVGDNTVGFSLVAGCGYDATIMSAAQKNKQAIGPMAYFQAALSNLVPTKSKFTIAIDGETIEREGLSVMVANFTRLQFDLALTHENRPRDGMLDVIVLTTENAIELLPALLTTWLDRDGGFPDRGNGVELFQGRHVTIDADPALPIQYDGETTDFTTPVEFSILPKAVRYVVSKECMECYSTETERALAEGDRAPAEGGQTAGSDNPMNGEEPAAETV